MRWCRSQKPAKSTASVFPIVAGCHPAVRTTTARPPKVHGTEASARDFLAAEEKPMTVGTIILIILIIALLGGFTGIGGGRVLRHRILRWRRIGARDRDPADSCADGAPLAYGEEPGRQGRDSARSRKARRKSPSGREGQQAAEPGGSTLGERSATYPAGIRNVKHVSAGVEVTSIAPPCARAISDAM